MIYQLVLNIGSLSNDGDDDGNESGKKAIDKQTTLLYVHHPFLYISFPSLHDHDLKSPKFYVLWRT